MFSISRKLIAISFLKYTVFCADRLHAKQETKQLDFGHSTLK